jgi:hypothetical protein
VDGKVLLTNGTAGGGVWVASVSGITGLNTTYRIEGNIQALNGTIDVYLGDAITPVATMVDEVGTIDTGPWTGTQFGLIHTSNQTDSLQFAAIGVSTTDRFGPAV